MIVYRLKHLPTEMYFCPSREIMVPDFTDAKHRKRYVKSNLSKKGKLYHKKPSFSYIGDKFYNHTRAMAGRTVWDKFIPAEWVVVEEQ